MGTKPDFILEVIVCSLEDAIEAERGGAHRLEVISHFEVGGLTPTARLVRDIREAVSLSLRVMLRETADYSSGGEAGVDRLRALARQLAESGAQGIVLGFLDSGEIDVTGTRSVLDAVPELNATFHHAFDEATDLNQAMRRLKTLKQVDRVLTSGGPGGLAGQIENLAASERAAQPDITVLAGGGLDVEKVRAIRAGTGIREYHVGRWARVPPTIDGAVSATRVREIIEQIIFAPSVQEAGPA